MTEPRCAACHNWMVPGAALQVTVRATGAVFYLHRKEATGAGCIALAGPASRTSIALADPVAAREYDRRAGGPSNHTAELERAAFFASHTPGGRPDAALAATRRPDRGPFPREIGGNDR